MQVRSCLIALLGVLAPTVKHDVGWHSVMRQWRGVVRVEFGWALIGPALSVTGPDAAFSTIRAGAAHGQT